MKIPLSQRLQACCAFVAPGDRVADVGCDHGYLGIYLLQQGIARSVIASDINQKPLETARRNAEKFGVADRMSFHRASGVRHVPHNFDVMVCAGMGADTIMSILSDAPWLREGGYRMILQCQSKRPRLRQYLHQQGYAIRRETLAADAGFLYPVMEVVYAPGQELTPAQYYISPALLADGSPLLPAFFDRVISGVEKTVEGLAPGGGEKYLHYRAIAQELRKEREAYADRSGHSDLY